MRSSTRALRSERKGRSFVATVATEVSRQEAEAIKLRAASKMEGESAAVVARATEATSKTDAAAVTAAHRRFFIRLRSSNSSAVSGSSGNTRYPSTTTNYNKRVTNAEHTSHHHVDKIRQLVDGGFVRRSLLQRATPSTASICGQFGIPNHLAMLEDDDRVKFYKEAILWQGHSQSHLQQLLPLRQTKLPCEQRGPMPQDTTAQELKPRKTGRSQVYGRRVLEIGCGPLALLSLLAVQQGAAQVDALELNPGVYQFASTFVKQIGVNPPPPQGYDLKGPQKPRLRVFRCYSKLFPLASWSSAADSTLRTPSASSSPALLADARPTTSAAAPPPSPVVLSTEGAAAATTAAAASGAGVGLTCGLANAGADGDKTTCTASVSSASWSPGTATAPPSYMTVAHSQGSLEGSSAAARAEATAGSAVDVAESHPSTPSWLARPLSCRSTRVAKRLRASPGGSRSRCRRKSNSLWTRKCTTSAQDSPSDHQVQQVEGELYDMVLHEILGDFASQEGAADVIRDIQERTGTIPHSIPFAARTFVGASEHPERTVLSPRERLLQSVGLRFSEVLLSTQLKAIEELDFEARMDTQMLQRRTLLFEVEKDGFFAGFLAAMEVEIRPGVFFGPVYEGQCDSWYTNVVLLGKEIAVFKGDRVILKTEVNLTNFQREQHMVGLCHSCSPACMTVHLFQLIFDLSVIAGAVAKGPKGRQWVSVSRPSYTFSGQVLPQTGCAETFGPIVIDFDEQACCV
ncbi:Conserved Plasmodium protein, related [Eimeria maxima]|uniref:Conserved Plasmodium protein, related n=1 Tax=Eimeria maxima TaxID=5804 RepID=U6MB02_EIMMA|nr:Conserved Plasmodium protein, related [Eimeria maxima]CDJ60228.1 Conserved Plasmodium protein, related [Eimeria maxima]